MDRSGRSAQNHHLGQAPFRNFPDYLHRREHTQTCNPRPIQKTIPEQGAPPHHSRSHGSPGPNYNSLNCHRIYRL